MPISLWSGFCWFTRVLLVQEMKQRRWEFLSLGAKEGGYAATWDWIQIMMVRGRHISTTFQRKGL